MADIVIDNTIYTSALSGEAFNIIDYGDGDVRTFKQTWEVTQNIGNFKWVVKTALYVKRTTPYTGASAYQEIYIDITYDGATHTQYLWDGVSSYALRLSGSDGVFRNGVNIASASQMKNSFTKLFEYTIDINCLSPKNKEIYITSGTDNRTHANKRGWGDGGGITATISPIILTLPPFSGFKLKQNVAWKNCLIWVKINGVWKKAISYIKKDGSWKRSV